MTCDLVDVLDHRSLLTRLPGDQWTTLCGNHRDFVEYLQAWVWEGGGKWDLCLRQLEGHQGSTGAEEVSPGMRLSWGWERLGTIEGLTTQSGVQGPEPSPAGLLEMKNLRLQPTSTGSGFAFSPDL